MKATGILTLAPLALLAPALLAASESRTWTFEGNGNISSGPGIWSFRKGGRIDGRFVRLDGTNAVIVKLVDGTARSVPYASLSEADRAYLARLKRPRIRAGPDRQRKPPKLTLPLKNETTILLVDVLEHGSTPEFPYTPTLRACELPRTKEARAACAEVLLALHQIQKSLEPEIGYEQLWCSTGAGNRRGQKNPEHRARNPQGFQ